MNDSQYIEHNTLAILQDKSGKKKAYKNIMMYIILLEWVKHTQVQFQIAFNTNFNYNTLYFHLIVNNMQLSVRKLYIQYTLIFFL